MYVCIRVYTKLLKWLLLNIDIIDDFYFLFYTILYFQNVNDKYIFNSKCDLQPILFPFLVIFCIECITGKKHQLIHSIDITVY